MKIIGITGKLESGKTTSANFIIDEYKSSKLLAFADLLKEMIYKAGICGKNELYGKKTKFSRKMMQAIGTKLIREQIDEDFWIKEMEKIISKTEKLDNINDFIIIHDVRFLNEAKLVKDLGGILIRVVRPKIKSIVNNIPSALNFSDNEINNHRSETEQDLINVDFEILNDSTLEDLRFNVLNVIHDFNRL